VPVHDGQHIYASINILMLRNACSGEDAIKRFLGPLQEVAVRLGKAIGSEIPGMPLDESTILKPGSTAGPRSTREIMSKMAYGEGEEED